jgi:hypothetical protein
MSFRTTLTGAAMAALILIIPGVTAAHAAAITPCDVMPTRCGYGANGRLYFYPPGYRVPNAGEPWGNRAVHFPERAAWGCGATDGKARGRSWNYTKRQAASYRALSECARKSVRGNCRIVSCRTAVHNSYEAIAIWGVSAGR